MCSQPACTKTLSAAGHKLHLLTHVEAKAQCYVSLCIQYSRWLGMQSSLSCMNIKPPLCVHQASPACTSSISCMHHIKPLLLAHQASFACTSSPSFMHIKPLLPAHQASLACRSQWLRQEHTAAPDHGARGTHQRAGAAGPPQHCARLLCPKPGRRLGAEAQRAADHGEGGT